MASSQAPLKPEEIDCKKHAEEMKKEEGNAAGSPTKGEKVEKTPEQIAAHHVCEFQNMMAGATQDQIDAMK